MATKTKAKADKVIEALLTQGPPPPVGVKKTVYIPQWLLDNLAAVGVTEINSTTTQAAFVALTKYLETEK